MALKRDARYPGRFVAANTAHPQGAFKNRSTPTAQDGSFLEADWMNDIDGFFARILNVAGVTPNGSVDDGSSSQLYNAMLLATPGRLANVQVITASGTVTKTANVKRWKIRLVGGGGGSSSAAATGSGQVSVSNGGGSGAYAEGIYDVSAITTIAVTVGVGGNGGTTTTQFGTDGGASSVGSLISAPGGKVGLPAGPANPPFQPVANNNSNSPTGFNIVGTSGAGAEPAVAVSINYAIGSRGANSQFGVGGYVVAINTAAVTGGGFGSGASGCSNGQSQPMNAGAAGRPGIVIIEEYY